MTPRTSTLKLAVLTLAPMIALSITSCENNKSDGPREEIGAVAVDAATATAAVVGVDSARRTVTLRWASGEQRTYKLGQEAVNFDQIKVGDQVKATVAESVAVFIGPAGVRPETADGATVKLAAKGDKPGVIAARTITVVDKIVDINTQDRTVTLQRAEGLPRTIKVSPAVNLGALRKGDDVALRVTEAVAIVVQKP